MEVGEEFDLVFDDVVFEETGQQWAGFGCDEGTIRQFVKDNAARLPSLTDPEQSGYVAQVMSVLRHFSVRFLDITIHAPGLRRRVIDENLYDLTATNLHAAIDQETGSLALDAIRARNDHVYRFCLGDLDGYISAVDTETTYCIDRPDSFISKRPTVH